MTDRLGRPLVKYLFWNLMLQLVPRDTARSQLKGLQLTLNIGQPLLKSLRLLKFSDIIHLEILCLFISGTINYALQVLLIFLTRYLLFIHIIHVNVNHRLIICLLHLFIPFNTVFILLVTLVQNFGILYPLMLRKSSCFPIFVNEYIKNSVIG